MVVELVGFGVESMSVIRACRDTMQCMTAISRASAALAAFFILFSTAAKPVVAANREKVLHSFGNGKDGSHPWAALISDAGGHLYGTTVWGGAYNLGSIFQLTRGANGSWTEKLIHCFGKGTDGANPLAGLTFDAGGNLYGTTVSGGVLYAGTVFRLSPKGNGEWSETVLHNFGGGDGSEPYAAVILDQAGNIYGTTNLGGAHDGGSVFKLAPDANGKWTVTVLYSFCAISDCADGYAPSAGVVLDKKGNLYGTTPYGGAYHGGVAFRLTRGANGHWSEIVLHNFGKDKDGYSPFAGLVFDTSGSLYGATAGGGAFGVSCGPGAGCGTVFKLTRCRNGRWSERVLHSFGSGKDGYNPVGDLVLDTSGNLYGTTSDGGAFGSQCGYAGCGTAFKVTHCKRGQWSERVLHNFGNGSDGASPFGALILDASGNLYGTTQFGGRFNDGGTVFEITP